MKRVLKQPDRFSFDAIEDTQRACKESMKVQIKEELNETTVVQESPAKKRGRPPTRGEKVKDSNEKGKKEEETAKKNKAEKDKKEDKADSEQKESTPKRKYRKPNEIELLLKNYNNEPIGADKRKEKKDRKRASRKKKDTKKDADDHKEEKKDAATGNAKKQSGRQEELMILSYPSNNVIGSVFVTPKMSVFEVRACINEELEGMEGFPDTEHYLFVSAKGVPISPKQEEDRLIGLYLPQIIIKDLEGI